MSADLEVLRTIFGDKRVHVSAALVQQVEVLPDRSKARAQCQCVPDDFEVVAEVAWGFAGPNAGNGALPVVGDLVLLAFTEERAYIIGRLSSKEDTIPKSIGAGHTALQAIAGKKLYLSSDTAVLIGSGGLIDPSEPLVLGNVLKTYLETLDTKITAIVDLILGGDISLSTSPGSPTAPNPSKLVAITQIKTDLVAAKLEFLTTTSTNILSQLAKTERGS